MARAIGLDLGSRFAKAVRLERTAKGLALLGYAVDEIPSAQGTSDVDPAWLRRLLSRVGWKAEAIGVALPAHETTLRSVSVPFTNEEQLADVIRFEAENHLPFRLEDVVIDFIPVRKDADGTEVLVFAVPKETLSGQQKTLEAAGLDPYLMGVEPVALLEALTGIGLRSEDPALLLDLGATTVKAIYLDKGRPTYMRLLRLPADLASGSAETLSGYVEKLSRELRRLMAAVPHVQPAKVLLSGGNALEPVAASLGRELEVEVKGLKPVPAGVFRQSPPEGLEQRGLIALGLALPLVGLTAFPFNLRKGEFRYRPKLEKLRKPLTVLLAGWMALAAVCAVGLEYRRHDLSRLQRRIEETEEAIWDSLSAGESKPANLLVWVDGELRRRQALSGKADTGSRSSALETLREILVAIPRGVRVKVRSVNISPERARIGMVADSHSAAAAIVNAVNANSRLVSSPKNLRYESGKSLFEIEAVPKERHSNAE